MFGLFRKKTAEKAVEQKSGSFSGSSFTAFVLTGEGSLSAAQAMKIYQDASSVNSAVRRIVDSAKTIAPVLKGPDGKMVEKHPLLDLLRNPNPFNSRENLLDDAFTHYLVTGDTDFFLAGNAKFKAVEVYALKPCDVSPLSSFNSKYPVAFTVVSGEGAGHYKVSTSGGIARYTDGAVKELVRVRSFSSRSDNCASDSPIMAAALEARQQIQARIHNLSILKNGARPSSIIAFRESLTEDEARERKEALNEQLAGAHNAGKIVVTGANGDGSSMMEIHELGQSNKDMDWYNLDKIASNAIYVTYKIPLPMVSNDASTFNNMENSVFHLYDQAILPCWTAVISGLSRVLLPRFGLDSSEWSIVYDPESIPALRTRTLEELKTRQTLGIETVNELRSQLPGREPIEGGDTLYQAANLVPVGVDLYTDDNTSSDDEARRLMQDRGK